MMGLKGDGDGNGAYGYDGLVDDEGQRKAVVVVIMNDDDRMWRWSSKRPRD
jgi:hypothetical protein